MRPLRPVAGVRPTAAVLSHHNVPVSQEEQAEQSSTDCRTQESACQTRGCECGLTLVSSSNEATSFTYPSRNSRSPSSITTHASCSSEGRAGALTMSPHAPAEPLAGRSDSWRPARRQAWAAGWSGQVWGGAGLSLAFVSFKSNFFLALLKLLLDLS